MAEGERRILLAEDDRFLRKAAEARLREGGFTVLAAVDGEEALRLARAETPDLVLLDLILFEIDDRIRSMIMERRDAAAIHRETLAKGMKTMFEDGLAKALLGETTLEEVFRVAL